MTGPAGYGSWSAIAAAIKAAAAQNAKAGGPDVNTQIAAAGFDRFLCRVFADETESGWLLKGGNSILARVPRSRSTTDVDLASAAGTLDDAQAALRGCAERDIGDHLSFTLTSSRVTGRGDNQPGVETRRLVFTCHDTATGRRVGDVPVDVVVGPAPVGVVETVDPANRLMLPRPLPTASYRLYPTVDHVADKFCATMARNYPGGQPSSRVKDLIDLVVIASTQRLELDQLRAAIATKRALSRLEPFDAFTVPQGWGRRYRELAAKTPAAGAILDIREAEAFAARLIDPALAPAGGPPAVWVPGTGWTDPARVPAASAGTGPPAGRGWLSSERHRRLDRSTAGPTDPTGLSAGDAV